MPTVTYQVVPHDGGWAYRYDGVYSETFPTKAAAFGAARRAAAEQRVAGDTEEILFENERGEWVTEHADGHDRPTTSVE